MKKSFVTLIIFLLIQSMAAGQKDGLASIQKNNLKAHMKFLASDELKGRETGSEENDIAAAYLRSGIMQYGLKPAAEDYYQNIPLREVMISHKDSYLKLVNSNGDVTFTMDSLLTVMVPSETMEAEGEIVFAGYGFTDEQSGYDDLAGIDLKDKIVVFMTRTPDRVKNNQGNNGIDFSVEGSKISNIVNKGPKAVICVLDPQNNLKDPLKTIYFEYSRSGIVAMRNAPVRPARFIFSIIGQDDADKLLGSTGKTLREYQDAIAVTGKPVSLVVPGSRASLKTVVIKREFEARNVIGIIEGSDPVLKNECIVYTAHFDHTGTDGNGEVFNGADDDASGTIALLEMARAFARSKKKPLRSVVFAWVTGEEKGLLGSEYYVNNPVMPLEKTILNINLDMVGRSWTPADTGKFYGFDLDVTRPGEVILYTKHESQELADMITTSAGVTAMKIIDKGEDIEAGGSDHESFWAKGVTAVMFHTGLHSDLHQISDDEARIDYDKMEQVTKLVFHLGYTVANRKEPLKVDRTVVK